MDNTSPQDNAVTPFAVTNYRDIRQRFGIKQKNRRGHMYVVGMTGTGKSTLIQNMAIHDIEAGYGLALIDPHGDLAEEILDSVPASRVNDVIYFNPSDLEYPLAFNPLEHVILDQRHLVVSGIISTLKKVWPEFWGPRLEHILRHVLLTLLEDPGSTLLDVPRLLTDEGFREQALRRVTHPQVRAFWFSEFARYCDLSARVQHLIWRCRAERGSGSRWGHRAGGGSPGLQRCPMRQATVPRLSAHGFAATEVTPGR